MQRRDFLSASLSIAGALAARSARSARGQPAIPTRAAVVIGVDEVGTAVPLKGACTGALAMAKWLHSEGFAVMQFVDNPNAPNPPNPKKPVKASDIYDAINGYIRLGTLDQLVVYFGGHGFIKGTGDEFGLLPGALDNPSEAINLTESEKFAWYAGIKNVVFISDACRSRAESLQIDAVSGLSIFPHLFEGGNYQVDRFLATAVGTPAYELKLKASKVDGTGIFTDCFLDAFKRPYAKSIAMVDGKPVVPNRKLQIYLEQQVPLRARLAYATLEQHPAARVNSSDLTYIGHVSSNERLPEVDGTPTVADVGRAALVPALGGAATPYSAAAIQGVAEKSGFRAAQDAIVQARGLSSQLATRTGFAISGQRVVVVTARQGIRTAVHNSPAGERPSALVEVDVQGPRAASVALRFTDGSGTVIAALDTFVGNIVVSDGRVANVTYVPSEKSPMRDAYRSEAKRLEQMHVAVATAVQFGVFRIDGPEATRNQKASQFANYIRVLKGIDPTLGIYAAYAYADSNLVEQVRSVRAYMRDNLEEIDLFDVAMLAGELAKKPPGDPRVCPFCPMLSQGWGYLRFKQVVLPEGVINAQNHLRNSLWLTLEPKGMRIVEDALRSGRVV